MDPDPSCVSRPYPKPVGEDGGGDDLGSEREGEHLVDDDEGERARSKREEQHDEAQAHSADGGWPLEQEMEGHGEDGHRDEQVGQGERVPAAVRAASHHPCSARQQRHPITARESNGVWRVACGVWRVRCEVRRDLVRSTS